VHQVGYLQRLEQQLFRRFMAESKRNHYHILSRAS